MEFVGEEAADYGGTRREFFRCLHQVSLTRIKSRFERLNFIWKH